MSQINIHDNKFPFGKRMFVISLFTSPILGICMIFYGVYIGLNIGLVIFLSLAIFPLFIGIFSFLFSNWISFQDEKIILYKGYTIINSIPKVNVIKITKGDNIIKISSKKGSEIVIYKDNYNMEDKMLLDIVADNYRIKRIDEIIRIISWTKIL